MRYGKSKQLIDDKEVSRNDEYYTAFSTGVDKRGRPLVEFQTVINKINNGYDSAGMLIKKLPVIYTNFTAAVNFYGSAHNIFYDINSRYKSLDDLFMLYDENLEKELLELKASMDSSVARLDVYRKLISEYPVDSYDQEYSLVPVNYYWLDGIAELSNFLQNDIRLWDYSAWVDGVLKVTKSDVKKLREKPCQVQQRP